MKFLSTIFLIVGTSLILLGSYFLSKGLKRKKVNDIQEEIKM